MHAARAMIRHNTCSTHVNPFCIIHTHSPVVRARVFRLVKVLQWTGMVVYVVCFVTIMDYIVLLFDCNWVNFRTAPMHMTFTDQNCLLAIDAACCCKLHLFGCAGDRCRMSL